MWCAFVSSQWRLLKCTYLYTCEILRYISCKWCRKRNYISISGLGGHTAISGCRSLLLSFGDTFFDFAVVGKLDFVTWIATILILDLFFHISQHDHKISPVSKKLHMFDVMPNNFWCTDWRPDCCISYSGKVSKGQRQMLNRNFLLIKKLSWGLFFTPSAIRGLISFSR